jgi:hypothetical protein
VPQLDFSTYFAQVFWLIVTFGVFFAVSKFYVSAKIDRVFFERENNVAILLNRISEMQTSTDNLRHEAEMAIFAARNESLKITQDAHSVARKAFIKFQHEQDLRLADNIKNLRNEFDRFLFLKIEVASKLKACVEFNLNDSRTSNEGILSDYIKSMKDVELCEALKCASAIAKDIVNHSCLSMSLKRDDSKSNCHGNYEKEVRR